MGASEPFDALTRFAEIERLVGKIYFRFSHLFLDQPEIRDFWWEMAREEEQHGCILHACKALIQSYEDETLDPTVSREKAQELEKWLGSFLQRGAPSLSVEEAFRIALEIESSEIDAIYSKLLHLGGPNIAKTMEYLGVPASVQRQKLKVALRRFCADEQDLLRAAEQL
jgi:rubrerythrin